MKSFKAGDCDGSEDMISFGDIVGVDDNQRESAILGYGDDLTEGFMGGSDEGIRLLD